MKQLYRSILVVSMRSSFFYNIPTQVCYLPNPPQRRVQPLPAIPNVAVPNARRLDINRPVSSVCRIGKRYRLRRPPMWHRVLASSEGPSSLSFFQRASTPPEPNFWLSASNRGCLSRSEEVEVRCVVGTPIEGSSGIIRKGCGRPVNEPDRQHGRMSGVSSNPKISTEAKLPTVDPLSTGRVRFGRPTPLSSLRGTYGSRVNGMISTP